jgi:hypothetical protein
MFTENRNYHVLTDHQRGGDFLDVVLTGPTMPPHGSTNSDRSIRNPTADNDICAS